MIDARALISFYQFQDVCSMSLNHMASVPDSTAHFHYLLHILPPLSVWHSKYNVKIRPGMIAVYICAFPPRYKMDVRARIFYSMSGCWVLRRCKVSRLEFEAGAHYQKYMP